MRVVEEPPKERILVPDDMGGIVEAAREAADLARRGLTPHVDFSLLRPEGAPIRGSGGTSSGPVSFLFEIFDHFLEWAALGAEGAGPVATLRYVYAPVLRVVRQGGASIPTPWSTPTGARCAFGRSWTPSFGAGSPTP